MRQVGGGSLCIGLEPDGYRYTVSINLGVPRWWVSRYEVGLGLIHEVGLRVSDMAVSRNWDKGPYLASLVGM